jgi:hypothetical protein
LIMFHLTYYLMINILVPWINYKKLTISTLIFYK